MSIETCCAEPADPLNHLVHLGYLPRLRQPCIILTVTVLVLSLSTLRQSYVLSVPNVLVAAFQLNSSRMFHSNITVWEISQAYKVGSGGSAGSVQRRLDCHKNSDLGSEAHTGTGLNSTMLCLIESVVLLTKLMEIVAPLILSIVVAVAQRLLLYNDANTR